ncbi:MAG: helix-turn-helix domain-containing protein [Deltaproteobacteria bacterium]|nr:helix-turn-helix domain-containing protein [Deltaproteobacteria bacterium]
MERTNVSLQNVLTENDLCELLGLKKNQIGDLRRRKGLPYIEVSKTARLYFEEDLINFFMKNRVSDEE